MNGQNVVKVGHRQVVNMIRQGGNSLMVKVVMVARNPELEDTVRKKGKAFPTTTVFQFILFLQGDNQVGACLRHCGSSLQSGCHW